MQEANPSQYRFDSRNNIVQINDNSNIEDEHMEAHDDDMSNQESFKSSDSDSTDAVEKIVVLKKNSGGKERRSRFLKMFCNIVVKLISYDSNGYSSSFELDTEEKFERCINKFHLIMSLIVNLIILMSADHNLKLFYCYWSVRVLYFLSSIWLFHNFLTNYKQYDIFQYRQIYQ